MRGSGPAFRIAMRPGWPERFDHDDISNAAAIVVTAWRTVRAMSRDVGPPSIAIMARFKMSKTAMSWNNMAARAGSADERIAPRRR